MQFRTVLTLVNLAAFVVALVVLEAFPAYAPIALYAFLGWMFASLMLFYSPWARRAPSPTAARGPSVSPDAPLASAPSPAPPSPIGFCIYCAAPIEPGATRCPACGHALPRLA